MIYREDFPKKRKIQRKSAIYREDFPKNHTQTRLCTLVTLRTDKVTIFNPTCVSGSYSPQVPPTCPPNMRDFYLRNFYRLFLRNMHFKLLALDRRLSHRLQHHCTLTVQNIHVSHIVLNRDNPDVFRRHPFKLRDCTDKVHGS